MDEQAKSEKKLQLEKVFKAAQNLPDRASKDCCQTFKTETSVYVLLNTEASIPEEPGAGNPHAGICAGAPRVTGRPTATHPRSAEDMTKIMLARCMTGGISQQESFRDLFPFFL